MDVEFFDIETMTREDVEDLLDCYTEVLETLAKHEATIRDLKEQLANPSF